MVGNENTKQLAIIDVDGVLADFESYFCSEFGSKNRHLYSLEDRNPNIPKDAIQRWVNNPENYADLAPIFGGILLLNEIKKNNMDVMLLTSRPRTAKKVTEAWLERYSVNYDWLHFSTDKLDTVSNLGRGVAVLVEDSTVTLEKFKKSGLVRFCLAWSQPWNDGYFPRLSYDEEKLRIVLESEKGSFSDLGLRK